MSFNPNLPRIDHLGDGFPNFDAMCKHHGLARATVKRSLSRS